MKIIIQPVKNLTASEILKSISLEPREYGGFYLINAPMLVCKQREGWKGEEVKNGIYRGSEAFLK